MAVTYNTDSSVANFLAAMETSGFRGDVRQDLATRTVMATDNSIYELVPKAVLFPKEVEDLNVIARLATEHGIAITARGGGTGTNGQSLTESVIVDCSRHLTKIEEINTTEGYAIVQPGVVLDDLNRAVAKHGMFFAPTVSTASRATIGGMAATDASGKGSRIYGRTSDHVLAMDLALVDGADLVVRTEDKQPTDRAGTEQQLIDLVTDILDHHADDIQRVFPQMNRGLTGYNLDQIQSNDGFSLVKLFCGSEGTLALTKRLKVRLLPKPKCKALMVVAYDDTLAALQDALRLVTADPSAVEFIDDKILKLAQADPIWSSIGRVLETDGDRAVLGLNFVEVQANDPEDLKNKIKALEELAIKAPAEVIDTKVVQDPQVIAQLWGLRSKCVGLLGRMDPSRQGTAFVEDAAVPPENLVNFVGGFRDILEDEGLSFGMFGHADVGCVHVRPALDMRRPDDAAMIRKVSDKVHQLALDHGGLIWGEHGKGFRGEYGPSVFGEALYRAICRIKALLDHDNLLNPGKIAAPDPAQPLVPLDAAPMRGAKDAAISAQLADDFTLAIKCNGNGQCFNRDVDDAMCPSYKATGDRRYSPKGRAALLREWMRQKSSSDTDALNQVEGELHDSLSACLSCKACTSQCPVKVDIPDMRNRFYEGYYQGNSRPIAHVFYALLDDVAPVLRGFPNLANLGMSALSGLLERAGLVDLPNVRPSKQNTTMGTGKPVVLLEDNFLATFDGGVIDSCDAVLSSLGYQVQRSGPLATGKALQVIGKRKKFAKTAAKTLRRLSDLAADGVPLVSVEPAFSSMFRQEYQKLGLAVPEVQTIEQFLHDGFIQGEWRSESSAHSIKSAPVQLFAHCSETAADPMSAKRWAALLQAFGYEAEPAKTGCCGMAGMFGHEAANAELSRKIFDLSWGDKLQSENADIAATGFSCRCQVKRFASRSAKHPVEYLFAACSAVSQEKTSDTSSRN